MPTAAAPKQFEEFRASALYCPRCRRAMPLHSRLLLVLPDGELHEYLCQACMTSLGTRTIRHSRQDRIIVP